MKKLVKKLVYKGTLEAITGLHIGAEKNTVEIGGIDNPVVRCVLKDRQPYIPGSSLKGKLRALMQIAYGEADEKQKPDSAVCQLFGAGDGEIDIEEFQKLPDEHYIKKNMLYVKPKEKEPEEKKEERKKVKLLGHRSRLIARDAYLTKESIKNLEKANEASFTDMPFTELKMENRIDRIRGVAEHPRSQERVPAGTTFDVEFIINIYENDDETRLTDTFRQAIEFLNKDYLGGSGTRGYGQVKISLNNPVEYKIVNGQMIENNSST